MIRCCSYKIIKFNGCYGSRIISVFGSILIRVLNVNKSSSNKLQNQLDNSRLF